MQIPAPRKSAYAARKDGDYERIVAAMRECETELGLKAVWTANLSKIEQMPQQGWSMWVDHLEEEYERLVDWLRHVNGRR